jgi:hypothetical protein
MGYKGLMKMAKEKGITPHVISAETLSYIFKYILRNKGYDHKKRRADESMKA